MDPDNTLQIIIGPMFSGKTKLLIKLYKQYSDTGNCMCVNYYKDTRYGSNKIISHDGESINSLSIERLSDINFKHQKLFDASNYIFINEAQFFPDLKNWICNILDSYNNTKHIILCGLDCDFKRHKFGEILDLIPFADNITQLRGTCSDCSKKNCSKFSFRISNNTNQKLIGSSDIYKPLCNKCYQNALQNISL